MMDLDTLDIHRWETEGGKLSSVDTSLTICIYTLGGLEKKIKVNNIEEFSKILMSLMEYKPLYIHDHLGDPNTIMIEIQHSCV